MNKYIEIVGSSNSRLNSMSRGAQLTILDILSKYYAKVAISIVDNLTDLEKLVVKKPDLVVLGMKFVLLDPSKNYDDTPKVWISNYLTKNDITFTGSDTGALIVEFDKPLAKQKIIDAGLRSSAYFISRINVPTYEHNLKFPLFVKPTNLKASKGIDENSIVYSQKEVELKILSIHNEHNSDALIEEYLSGREFSVAVIRQANTNNLRALPIEITTPLDSNGNSFLSEAVKHADSEEVSAITNPMLRNAVNNLAIGVFMVLGSRDYGRIDIRLDSLGEPNFIEANLMPGLSNHGYLSRCFYLNENITYEDMILTIANLGLEKTRSLITKTPTSLSNYTDNTIASGLLAQGV